MKKYVKASYEDKFWDLYDKVGMEESTKLEDIISDLGIEDKVFPPEDDEEPTASEEDYKKVMELYAEGASIDDVIPRDLRDVMLDIVSSLRSTKGVKHPYYEESIDAVRFTLADGHEYQLVLQDMGRF